jgi:YD repeat-containing protein
VTTVTVTATMTDPTTAGPALDTRTAFLEHLPKIREHAKFALRHVGCPDTPADLVGEAVALAWKHFDRLARRGKRPERFVTTLALRCTQAVRAGRRLAGSDSSRDVLLRPEPQGPVRGDGNQTTWVYDVLNRVKTETDPLGHNATTTYDAAGRLPSRTDRFPGQPRAAFATEGQPDQPMEVGQPIRGAGVR